MAWTKDDLAQAAERLHGRKYIARLVGPVGPAMGNAVELQEAAPRKVTIDLGVPTVDVVQLLREHLGGQGATPEVVGERLGEAVEQWAKSLNPRAQATLSAHDLAALTTIVGGLVESGELWR